MSSVPTSPHQAKELLVSVRDRLTDVEKQAELAHNSVTYVENQLYGEEYDTAGAGVVVTEKGAVFERLDELEDENQTLRGRLEAMEARLDVVEENDGGKEAKVRRIVQYAENVRNPSQDGVIVSAKEIKGAAGCSRRYAYDLIDDLPDEYHWIISRQEARQKQYGNLELNSSKQTKAVLIDFEALHNDEDAVNKFTTPTGSEEESR